MCLKIPIENYASLCSVASKLCENVFNFVCCSVNETTVYYNDVERTNVQNNSE